MPFNFNLDNTLQLLLVFVMTFVGFTRAYLVELDVQDEKCFLEQVNDENAKLSVIFDVIEGGFNEVDFIVHDPSGRVVHAENRISSGKYLFVAGSKGAFEFCFSNKHSSRSVKLVSFESAVESARDMNATEADKTEETEYSKQVYQLNSRLHMVRYEGETFRHRMDAHNAINESTNRLLTYWALFESGLITVMVCTQVYYIRRFFEVRRMV